jgi:hypothetical protein
MVGTRRGRALPSRTLPPGTVGPRTPPEFCRMAAAGDGVGAAPRCRHATKFQGPGIKIPGGGARGGSAPSQSHTHP